MSNDFEFGTTREEKIDKFLDVLAWFHSEKQMPTGFFRTIGRIEQEIQILNQGIASADKRFKVLNENIAKANDSSTKLTEALNRITLAGVIIAGLGLLVTIISMILQVSKLI